MEYFLPLLIAAFNKTITAALAIMMFWLALRLSDKMAGISFKSTWSDSHANNKLDYFARRQWPFAAIFCIVFAFG